MNTSTLNPTLPGFRGSILNQMNDERSKEKQFLPVETTIQCNSGQQAQDVFKKQKR